MTVVPALTALAAVPVVSCANPASSPPTVVSLESVHRVRSHATVPRAIAAAARYRAHSAW